MKKLGWSFDPECMSPEERENRVVKLLAMGAYRMAIEKINGLSNQEETDEGKQENDLNIPIPPTYP